MANDRLTVHTIEVHESLGYIPCSGTATVFKFEPSTLALGLSMYRPNRGDTSRLYYGYFVATHGLREFDQHHNVRQYTRYKDPHMPVKVEVLLSFLTRKYGLQLKVCNRWSYDQ